MIPSISLARRLAIQMPDPRPALLHLRKIATLNHAMAEDAWSWEDADHWRRVAEELTNMINALPNEEEEPCVER